uniref:Uncharacterized protein n=1 Tax=viral metagenome TaxID=1070528 RepID=A0A6H2A526_9ZZZZ
MKAPKGTVWCKWARLKVQLPLLDPKKEDAANVINPKPES